jgi:hypothetical protein
MARSKKTADRRHVASNVEETIATDRRKFVTSLGMAVLTVRILPLIANDGTPSPSDGKTAEDLVIHSGAGAFGHVHDLVIPYALLTAPPREGVRLTSSKALLHTHEITLTREELVIVNTGKTITKKSSSHVFVIALSQSEPHD